MGINNVAFAEFCLLLNSGLPKTQETLRQETGMCSSTFTLWMRLLKRKELVYTAGWRRTTTGWVALWAWGYKVESVPKPKPQSAAQSCRKYRRNKRIEQEKQGEQSNGNQRSARNIQQNMHGRNSGSGDGKSEGIRILESVFAAKIPKSHESVERS